VLGEALTFASSSSVKPVHLPPSSVKMQPVDTAGNRLHLVSRSAMVMFNRNDRCSRHWASIILFLGDHATGGEGSPDLVKARRRALCSCADGR
jgi:hypothetical protein